jgi:hypothetical protein
MTVISVKHLGKQTNSIFGFLKPKTGIFCSKKQFSKDFGGKLVAFPSKNRHFSVRLT